MWKINCLAGCMSLLENLDILEPFKDYWRVYTLNNWEVSRSACALRTCWDRLFSFEVSYLLIPLLQLSCGNLRGPTVPPPPFVNPGNIRPYSSLNQGIIVVPTLPLKKAGLIFFWEKPWRPSGVSLLRFDPWHHLTHDFSSSLPLAASFGCFRKWWVLPLNHPF